MRLHWLNCFALALYFDVQAKCHNMCVHVCTFCKGVVRLQITDTHLLATSRNKDLRAGCRANCSVLPFITSALAPLPPSHLPGCEEKARGRVDRPESKLLLALPAPASLCASNSCLRDSNCSLVSSCCSGESGRGGEEIRDITLSYEQSKHAQYNYMYMYMYMYMYVLYIIEDNTCTGYR